MIESWPAGSFSSADQRALGSPQWRGHGARKRPRATLIELDDIRSLIVSGLADPQQPGELQDEQYELSVGATCAVARTFAAAGYDAAVADVLEPAAFERFWRPQLEGCDWQMIILLPSLEETLARSAAREKRVLEKHTREQHRRTSEWPEDLRIDTSRLSVESSLELVQDLLTTGRAGGAEA